MAAFVAEGYEEGPDGAYETGHEKVALYAGSYGEPTHMARQVDDYWWTSKLGHYEDIRHTLHALDGPIMAGCHDS